MSLAYPAELRVRLAPDEEDDEPMPTTIASEEDFRALVSGSRMRLATRDASGEFKARKAILSFREAVEVLKEPNTFLLLEEALKAKVDRMARHA